MNGAACLDKDKEGVMPMPELFELTEYLNLVVPSLIESEVSAHGNVVYLESSSVWPYDDLWGNEAA